MAGVAAHPPTASTSTASSPKVNGNANLDYINGHGALPDPSAASVPPATTSTKKGKNSGTQKPVDDKKNTSKLLAAKINELEHNTKSDKEQEAEIGSYAPMSQSPNASYTYSRS